MRPLEPTGSSASPRTETSTCFSHDELIRLNIAELKLILNSDASNDPLDMDDLSSSGCVGRTVTDPARPQSQDEKLFITSDEVSSGRDEVRKAPAPLVWK